MAAKTQDMIEATGLTKKFGDFTAVDQVSLSVPAGQVVALLGPNGAGKTTTVRMLAGILAPTAGRATVGGLDVTRSPEQVRRRVGVLTEMPGLYLRMQAMEYLDFFGQLYGLSASQRRARAAALLSRFGMAEAVDRRLGEYSKGMRQKLALIRAMLHDPRALLLDEPTSAMDPQSAHLVRDAIANLRDDQRAIVLCTHNLAEAEALADRIAIIRRGRIIAEGTAAALKSQLLGPPLMELRLAASLDGLLPGLLQQVEVVERGDVWVRYRTENPTLENPRLLRWLAERDADVVTLSEVARSLEDVYLRVVAE
jgi:ABC-2 type transport system ATP-binding protein